jgi:phosphatidylserine/phosphatidylglycerophosphate/cardiolipin synthase-like enzyme
VKRLSSAVRALAFAALASLASCSATSATPTAPSALPPCAPAPVSPSVELVESTPIETTLDNADVADAYAVWPAMFDRAERSLDIAEFYASSAPKSRLEPVLAALERATKRGVRVRFLLEKIFLDKYPETVARLRATPGVDVRVYDIGPRTGGILHAKYFVVDDREAFVGSQNFDWRALEHIQELGVRVSEPAVVEGVAAIFADDWALAGGEAAPPRSPPLSHGAVRLAASPEGLLPAGIPWDLPLLVGLLDGARSSIRLQLLAYKARARDGSPFTELDDALRRAAARGVEVELLVSSWGNKDDAVLALARVPHVRVRVLTIPPWSGGEIPFARVAHAKYLVVDGAHAWVGTSNWEGDYFTKSRNLSLFLDDSALAWRIGLIFDGAFGSAYAAPLAP